MRQTYTCTTSRQSSRQNFFSCVYVCGHGQATISQLLDALNRQPDLRDAFGHQLPLSCGHNQPFGFNSEVLLAAHLGLSGFLSVDGGLSGGIGGIAGSGGGAAAGGGGGGVGQPGGTSGSGSGLSGGGSGVRVV